MADIRPDRLHAQVDDDFVLFVVGMRVNRLRSVHRWLPVFLAAPRMVREQRERPDGLLDSTGYLHPPREFVFVQYWRSFEALRTYARDPGTDHRTWWGRYNERVAGGAVGIWHETYLVDSDDYESVYRNMPPHGLGATDAAELVAATGRRETASGRLGRTDGSDAPVGPDGDDPAGPGDE